MDNDINTSLGVTALYDVLKADISDAAKLQLIAEFDAVLSLNLIAAAEVLRGGESTSTNPDAGKIEALIAERAEVRKAKNWARADEIRDELTAMGIVVEDTPEGAKWKRV